ncbi:MAG: hypothetical protein LBP20_11025 [Treponema sp.]|jgi:hypothetical protein|nr:hypothetical protein [Treponema sp.]
MREIWIPELLSSLFVLVFLVRPLFKKLWPLDGIAWFPVLALGVALSIFPAYGFRPECIPLALNHLVIVLTNLNPLFMGVRRNAWFRERGALFIVPAFGFLVLVSAAALYFAPVPRPAVNSRTFTLRDTGGPVYTLHVFEGRESGMDSGEARPLIFLVPPGFGRLDAVDGICAALGERGFTVISYVRRNSMPPGALFRFWRVFRDGTVLKKANGKGRELEAEKQAEIEFLLPYVKENLASLAPAADGDALFLAGWGAGGSALAYLVSASGPAGKGDAGSFTGPAVAPSPSGPYGARGLVVVEGRLWSSWVAAPSPEHNAVSSNVFAAVLTKIRDWFRRLRPERVEGFDAIPQPPVPALYLVSGQAPVEDEGTYAAVFAALRNSPGPAALACVEGAGPLDYSDIPVEYPVYNALLSGYPGGRADAAAALIARFCELVNAGPLETRAPAALTGRFRLPGGLYLETRYWNFGDLRLH